MAQPNATRELGQLAKSLSHKDGLILRTGQANLLHEPREIRIPEPISLFAHRVCALAESVKGSHLLCILQMIDLLGEMHDKRVDLQFKIGVLVAQGPDGFSSLLHKPFIGQRPSQLNTIRDRESVLMGRGVKNRQNQDLTGRRFQSK